MEKKHIAYFSISLVGLLFIIRLFYIQIVDEKYQPSPLNNSAVAIKFDYPARGFIYDRNGVLLVANQPSYDVMIIPRDVAPLDTLEFCGLLKITKEEFLKNFNKAKTYSPRIPSVFLAQLSKANYAFLQEKMHKFKGFYIQKRILREYPLKTAANVLGYIGEVSPAFMEKNPYYKQGELRGITGIENEYEEVLRGVRGVKFMQRNRFNKEIGPYQGGSKDTLATPGKDLTITLDIALQQYGQKLMSNKRGGIIAIEPATGELLTVISTPTYDPNELVGRERSKNYARLDNDINGKPMFDRGLQAQYPPGSPFKIVNALIGLQEGVVTTDTRFTCYHGYRYGSGPNAFMGCHCVSGTSNDLTRGVYASCNAYFCNVYKRLIEKYPSSEDGIEAWAKHVRSFGFGDYLHNDLYNGTPGTVPDASLYKRMYPNGGWRASTTISNAIGQGEILANPIQLANMTAAVANRGFYYTPHIIKEIDKKPIQIDNFTTPKQTTIDPEHFEPVIEGMYQAVENPGGTAYWSKVKGIEICGKTGTAENFTRVNGEKLQFKDHSVFIAFAPKDNPKIAIAVYIENGGYGSAYAGPIATLMIEKYLNGKTTRPHVEKKMFEDSLQDQYDQQLLEISLAKEKDQHISGN